MFTKNYLTRNLKSLLIEAAVVSVKPARLAETMSTILNCIGKSPLILADRWVFRVFKKSAKSNQNYVQLSTTRKKTSSEKLANNTLKKYINYILSQIYNLVKGKIADMYFKPKKRDFTLEDLTLIQKLVDKNKGDFPKSWAQFYKLTGTNPETFNN